MTLLLMAVKDKNDFVVDGSESFVVDSSER